MKIGIAIDGLEGLDEMLRQLGVEVATKLGDKAFKASAEKLQQAWIAGAPYQPRALKKYWTTKGGITRSAFYGHLRDNIRVRKVRPENQNAIVYGVHTGDAFWSYFLEFGTVAMPAHPWARPIVERMKSELVATQVVIFNQGIEDFAARSARRRGKSTSFGPVMANGRNG